MSHGVLPYDSTQRLLSLLVQEVMVYLPQSSCWRRLSCFSSGWQKGLAERRSQLPCSLQTTCC